MSEKKEIVGFTAGNFDLMHPGYIYTFEDAKKHCDKFIVFLQRDPSLHRKSKYINYIHGVSRVIRVIPKYT